MFRCRNTKYSALYSIKFAHLKRLYTIVTEGFSVITFRKVRHFAPVTPQLCLHRSPSSHVDTVWFHLYARMQGNFNASGQAAKVMVTHSTFSCIPFSSKRTVFYPFKWSFASFHSRIHPQYHRQSSWPVTVSFVCHLSLNRCSRLGTVPDMTIKRSTGGGLCKRTDLELTRKVRWWSHAMRNLRQKIALSHLHASA